MVEEALKLFDKVVVAIGHNIQKRGFLPVEAREALVEKVYENNPRVDVTTYTTLTGDEAKRVGAVAMIRSVRNMADFDYERTIANANRYVYGDLSTVIVLVPVEVEHISSSLVRELHAFGRDVDALLPEGIVLSDYLK